MTGLPLFDRYAPPEDITERKHGRVETSVAAFDAIRSSLSERRASVLAFIKSRGAQGATSDEIAERFGVPLNAISGRCSELLRDALIYTTGDKRPTRLGHSSRVLYASHKESE